MPLDLHWYTGNERDMYIPVCILFTRLESSRLYANRLQVTTSEIRTLILIVHI